MDNQSQQPLLPRVSFGIWIPGAGWWKTPRKDGGGAMDVYQTAFVPLARRYAKWLKRGARVEALDPALIAAEAQLLAAEKAGKDGSIRSRPLMVLSAFKAWMVKSCRM